MDILGKLLTGAVDLAAFFRAQDAATFAMAAAACAAAYFALVALFSRRVPRVSVALTAAEREGIPGKKWVPGTKFPKDRIPCYDPGNLEMLGPDMPAMTADEVRAKIERARVAQKEGQVFVRQASPPPQGDRPIHPRQSG